jgi:hypothetical protein
MTKIFQSDSQAMGGDVFDLMAKSSAKKAAIMRFAFLAVLLIAISTTAFGQALPAAEATPISTGFVLPRTSGTLNYSVGVSQSLNWGYYGNSGVAASTSLTGNLAYLSNSKQNPFSIVLTAGHGWSESDQPANNFAGLSLSQVANFGRWNFVLGDSFSYLPGTPTYGLSGVPGVGDLGIGPVQVGGNTGQGVYSNYGTRATNSSAVSIQRRLTGKTSINGTATYGIMRFLGNTNGAGAAGLDNDSISGGGGINHQIDTRNSVGGNYNYSTYEYPGNTQGVPAPGFSGQTVSAFYSHQFTRKLSMSISAGPQWSLVDYAGSKQQLSTFISASVGYSGRFSHGSAAFVRDTNSGFGVIGGALSTSAIASADHTFARVWNCAFSLGYTQTQSLPAPSVVPYTFHTTFVGIQTSRALIRSLSAYASYALQNQTQQGSPGTTVNAFDGLSNVVGFGLTYAPASFHFGSR